MGLGGVDERGGGTRAPDQGLRVRQHDRIVPWALHHEGQVELVGIGRRYQRRHALEIEVARRHRGLAADRELHRRSADMHVGDRHRALVDLQIDDELIERRRAGAEVAATGERPALQPAQQLFDIDAVERAGMGGEACCAVERAGHRHHGRAGAVDIHRQIAAALDLVDAEDLAEAIVEIDIDELHVRGHADAVVGDSKTQTALGSAAEGLRLADCEIELAIAQIGGDCGASELRGRELDTGRGEPQVEIEVVETAERDRQRIPIAFIPRQ